LSVVSHFHLCVNFELYDFVFCFSTASAILQKVICVNVICTCSTVCLSVKILRSNIVSNSKLTWSIVICLCVLFCALSHKGFNQSRSASKCRFLDRCYATWLKIRVAKKHDIGDQLTVKVSTNSIKRLRGYTRDIKASSDSTTVNMSNGQPWHRNNIISRLAM